MPNRRLAIGLSLLAALLAAPVSAHGDELRGDWNGDGKLTAVDALAAMKMAAGKMPAQLRMDVDGDGKVTEEDARRILEGAVGIEADRPLAAPDEGASEGPAASAGPIPASGITLEGRWAGNPPAWTPDGAALVVAGAGELQLYRISLADRKARPLVASLPSELGQLVSANEKNLFDLRIEGDHVHATLSALVGSRRVFRLLRVPSGGGTAEDLGERPRPTTDKWWEAIPGDWVPAAISADRTVAAVTSQAAGGGNAGPFDPIHLYRLPDRLLGRLEVLPTDRNAYRPLAFSPDGTVIACVPHKVEPGSSTPHRLLLVWLDDLGRAHEVTRFGGWAYGNFSFSPDGKAIAIQIEYDEPGAADPRPRQEIRVFPVSR
jgi:hypothetical protein